MQHIGQLRTQSGRPLVKMWCVTIDFESRPFVKHSHSSFEITVVNSGSGAYTTESAVYPMEAGDVFVFSSNEIHCITACGPEGLRITNLHFEPQYLYNENAGPLSDELLSFCFSHSAEFENRIPAAKAETIRFHHNRIQEEFSNQGVMYPLAVKSFLDLILVDLLRSQHYRPTLSSSHGSGAINMLAVYEYIELHLCEELTLNSVAELVHLSPNYFSHLFRQLSGIPLWDYIIAKRIDKAAHLLIAQNSATVAEIALQCGFNNTVNFNKAFKKHVGVTPSQLRRNPSLYLH